MSSEKPRAGSRRKFSLQSALWAVALFSLAGVLALAQEAPPQLAPAPAVEEVIQAVVEAPQSLPVPDPTPEPALTPAPSKTPDSSAAGATFPESPALNPVAPLRAADVQFPTPPGAPTNEPLVMIGRPVPKSDYGSAGNLQASRLRSMPPDSFTFDRSALRDVFRLLAEEAGIPYIGIPEHSPKAQRLVTFKMTASPFAALESLARQNDIKLTYEDGVWFMGQGDPNLDRARRAERENELIGVIYQLKFDPVDVVDFRASGAGGGVGGAAGGIGGNTGTQGGNTGNSGSSFGNQMPLQYSQRVFEAKAPRIVNEIRVMLGMKPLEYGDSGQVSDPETTSGTMAQSMSLPPFDGVSENSATASSQQQGAPATGGSLASLIQGVAGAPPTSAPASAPTSSAGSSELFPVYVPPQKPQVIYNSDSNLLWVVATRKQHKWVADYLSRVDKPQDLIAIEVKFFETNKNPQTDFGINWEGVFGGDGLQVTGAGSVGSATSTGDLNSFTIGGQPYSAVLTVQQATLAVQAFTRDREGSLVQYPRVLTINNREVAITSAENTPINTGTQNVGNNAVNSQTVGTVQYLPTGTQINILPKAVGKDQIALTVAITISSIIDQVPIDLGTGVNQYPVTAERVYNASLQVDSGYTLAVGGLEKSTDLRNTGGIPLLKDIPGVGYLFKNKSRSRNRSNLIIFITPYVIDDPSRTPGISEKPDSTLPVRPGSRPPAPTFAPDGRLIGGSGAVSGALAWLEYQLRYFRQINKEARDDGKTINELRGVIERARVLSGSLQQQVLDAAGYASAELLDNSARADVLLVELNKVLAAAQVDQFQLREGFP